MTGTRTRAGIRLILAALLLTGALSACGKKGLPVPPEGEEGAYTYPRTYPSPASALPPSDTERGAESRRAPAGAGDISPFPKSRTKTTYGAGTPQ